MVISEKLPSIKKDNKNSISFIKQKQNEYLSELIEQTIQAENERQKKLIKAKSIDSRKKLEIIFNKERKKDRERIEYIQLDNISVLQAKTEKQLLLSSSNCISESIVPKNRKEIIHDKHANPTSISKKSNDYGSHIGQRLLATTTQEAEFYKQIYSKDLSMTRSNSMVSLSALNLNKLQEQSEGSLQREKERLLKQLNEMNTIQQKKFPFIQSFNKLPKDDDCVTIRSSVSTFK